MRPETFSSHRWTERLGRALESLVPELRAGIPYVEQDTAGRRHEYVHWTTDGEFPEIAQAAPRNPAARVAVEQSSVRLDDEPLEAIELLREHPVVKRALSEAADRNAVAFISPYRSIRVDLKTLVASLVKLTVATNPPAAASTLHRFLTRGDERALKAYEITVFDGLALTARIDIADGAYLAPYGEVRDAYGAAAREQIRALLAGAGFDHGADDATPERACALVREMRWGPAVMSVEGAPETTPHVDWKFALDRDLDSAQRPLTHKFPEDYELVGDLLAIASGHPCVPRLHYIHVAKWMEALDENVRFGWSSGLVGSRDPWPGNQLVEEEAARFLVLVRGWQSYEREREQLRIPVRRLAASRWRRGRFGAEDRILDTAIALEMMYGLTGSEISYKLKTRAAFFLGEDAETRREVFQRIETFYSARSTIVHGPSKRRKRQIDLNEAASVGFEIGSSTLRLLLHRGSPPDWKELVLSGGETR